MNDYEKKLAVKQVNADARRATSKWHKLATADIYDILYRMGYTGSRCGYKFTKRYWAGMEEFTLQLDTYGLIIGNTNKIEAEVL